MGVDALDITTCTDVRARLNDGVAGRAAMCKWKNRWPFTIAEVAPCWQHKGISKLCVRSSRRNPLNRLAKALIDAGMLGRPFLAVQWSSGSGENVIITLAACSKHTVGSPSIWVCTTPILEYTAGTAGHTTLGLGAVIDTERKGNDGTMYTRRCRR